MEDNKGRKPFQFYEALADDPGCGEIVRKYWCQPELEPIERGLSWKSKVISSKLQKWKSKNWGKMKNNISDRESELLRLLKTVASPYNIR